ncbi:TlpA family protein disulfide reductase [Geminicoccus roseus]|uniref:TlpA family protein disulfide reductase n=1 Tax=Geminicoccus roseus TaxID=404900 RepID=UPI0003F918E5|nr:TlpA disulfide reductase family protein [Geminicoccus roseus]
MDRRRLLLTTALASLAGWTANAAEKFDFRKPDERTALPEIKYLDESGNETDLSALQGRVVVLNLWATWCAPCRTEMPSLDRLQAKYPKEEVLVLALSVDRAPAEKVQAFMDEVGAEHLTIGRDPTVKAARLLGAPGLPATIVIDQEGLEVGRLLGIAEWDGPQATALIDELLAG